jgi:hypothetical protein
MDCINYVFVRFCSSVVGASLGDRPYRLRQCAVDDLVCCWSIGG